mgnify:CR=1 FL=1
MLCLILHPVLLDKMGKWYYSKRESARIGNVSIFRNCRFSAAAGVSSTGVIKEVIGITEDLTDRTVVIVEDIVDTGLTMQRLLDTLGTRNPKEIHITSLLVKPDKLKVDLNIEYVAMEIPNDFIVGYGLDYDGFGRNYADIYTVVD